MHNILWFHFGVGFCRFPRSSVLESLVAPRSFFIFQAFHACFCCVSTQDWERCRTVKQSREQCPLALVRLMLAPLLAVSVLACVPISRVGVHAGHCLVRCSCWAFPLGLSGCTLRPIFGFLFGRPPRFPFGDSCGSACSRGLSMFH